MHTVHVLIDIRSIVENSITVAMLLHNLAAGEKCSIWFKESKLSHTVWPPNHLQFSELKASRVALAHGSPKQYGS